MFGKFGVQRPPYAILPAVRPQAEMWESPVCANLLGSTGAEMDADWALQDESISSIPDA